MLTKERENELRRDAARTADKYIKKEGKGPEVPKAKLTPQQVGDLVNVASFIIFQPANSLWGGIKKEAAVKSLARIFRLSEFELTTAIMNPKSRSL